MSDEAKHEPLLDSKAAATVLGVSHWWLLKARSNGTGPKFIKIGRAVRYSKADLLDFINNNKHTANHY
jgi:predicted DNA-binding transcriptional regulator AlpA